MGKLLLLFTIVPLLEVYLLYALGSVLGFWPTVAIVLVTGFMGAFLAKREGLKVWRAWREAIARGELPEDGLVGGVLVLLGGVLLVAPGVLTDVTGLLLLIPPTRRVIANVVRARLQKRIEQGSMGFRYRVEMGDPRIIEDLRAHFGAQRRHAGDVVETEGEVVGERRRGDARAELEG